MRFKHLFKNKITSPCTFLKVFKNNKLCEANVQFNYSRLTYQTCIVCEAKRGDYVELIQEDMLGFHSMMEKVK